MEPDLHRLDREAMLVDRAAVAERIALEVDEIVAAAAAQRFAHAAETCGRRRARGRSAR
jgi:hypothetical protein